MNWTTEKWKRNEKCDLCVGFDDSLKVYIDIVSMLSRTNGMIELMLRNIISKEANIILEIYKTLTGPHIENYTQAWVLVSKYWNRSETLK